LLRQLKKIAYIHTHSYGAYESGPVFVTNTVRGFAENGLQGLVIAPRGLEPVDEVLLRLGISHHPDMKIELLPSFHLKIGSFHPSWNGPYRVAASDMARRWGAEAVICRDLKMARQLIKDRFPGLILYEIHNIYAFGEDARDVAFFPESKITKGRARIPLESEVLGKTDGVITLTRGLAELLVKTRPVSQRVVVAGSACRPLADPPGTADRHHIAYVGALDPHKGVGNLVKVLDRLPMQARLLIFGNGKQIKRIQEIASHVGVLDRVDFAGYIPPERLPHHLARCRAGAVPLVDCFYNRMVTSPMKIFEYLASGVPPILPDFPAFREIFTDSSPVVFFKPGDDESLAAAIGELFHDDATFRRRHLAALAQATKWTWKDRAGKIIEFINDLPFRKERNPDI
jgi:glycosyltransferase involved in cell wall biosynthesis